MNFQLNHFGLVCQDLPKSLAVYSDQLANQLTARWYNRGYLDIAFLGGGSNVTVELVGPPHLDYEQAHIARHGYSINHTSFQVDDAQAAFEELKSQGVEVAWEPMRVITMLQCGLRDADGLLFEVYSNLDPALPLAGPDLSEPPLPADLRLHHVSILTPDLRRSQRFYTEMLGLTTVYEYVADDGGFVFLADPYYDPAQHDFLLEIIGPPHLEPREEVLLKQRGACYDHFCYVANDVGAAWQACMGRGALQETPPARELGTWIAWLKDADGNDVEIMGIMPSRLLAEALRTGRYIDGMAA
jgi:catechol 2,3-dioxygenase-like lactoylglutathione lyase family enzyme